MAQIREELILYDRFTNTFTSYIRQAERASGAVNGARRATDQFSESQRTATAATNSLGNALKRIVSIYAIINGTKRVLNMSDQLASTTARLDTMNDGLQTTAELQDMIYQSAQRSRGLYTDTAAFVAKLGTLAGSAFDSNQEIIAFAEQINKQMALSGTTTQEAQAAMLQLTQGLSSGVLRGEELNSVLEQTPMIAQSIAKYMGVTTGEMRELASEGKVTAEVVKNAMFAAAEETNAAFEDMPRTWGQVWNEIQNVTIKALGPLFDALNDLANSDFMDKVIHGVTIALNALGTAVQFVVDNIDTIAPVVAIATEAWIAYKVAVWAANIAMTANPIGIVIALLVALVGVLVWAWDSFEGFRKFYADMVAFQMNITAKVYNFVMDATRTFATFVIDRYYDMGVGVVNAINTMMTPLRMLADAYNSVAEVIGAKTIDFDFRFSTSGIDNLRDRALEKVKQMTRTIDPEKAGLIIEDWSAKIADFRFSDFISEKLGGVSDAVSDWVGGIEAVPYEDLLNQAGTISDAVSGIEKAVNMSEEDLKSLVDVAERRYVNQVNLTAQTPVITINGANTGSTAADRQNLADAIRDILVEQVAAGSVRSTAMAF